jgi:hypothetical protein
MSAHLDYPPKFKDVDSEQISKFLFLKIIGLCINHPNYALVQFLLNKKA